ncbi:arylsulfatase [Limibacter armeniacum]|uniref:arylsulfatase n=1 Tax=Limibacter armeniacum TaxID=466084 RepID=UPI002FE52FFA
MTQLLKILFSLSVLLWLTLPLSAQKKADRPNIILIMADDMGYSDVGCYGSEIPTPNIDRLAKNGVRMSSFYNQARCCPTRATLMTGLFPHQTGIGQMTNSPKGDQFKKWGTEGYIGYLNRKCVTMAEALKEAGYNTYMAGKWHLGYHQQDRWPLQRGYDRYYGIISGASSYFAPKAPRGLTLDNTHVQPEGENYYTTDAFTDYAIEFIEGHEKLQPYFLYLAYNAPHWPLQAKAEDIELFKEKYKAGWDVIRKARYEKQQQLGLFEGREVGLSPRDEIVRPWEQLSEKEQEEVAYRMAVYAAQIYSMDQNIGKLISKLEERNELDNTLIIFLSDNGGCAEPYKELGGGDFADINNPAKTGAISYGQGWANVSNTPFSKYKVYTHEGGISTPLIAHWPKGLKKKKGEIVHQPAYLIDVMPTVLEAANAQYPKVFHQGNDIHPLEGNSLIQLFKKGKGTQHEYMFWEHQNNCAVRYGEWKMVKKLKDQQWQLYDLTTDRTEQHDVSAQHPELVKQLDTKWQEWAISHYVLPKKLQEK